MPAWRELREGTSVIRVIDDPAEAERLCLRKAPGAEHRVGWMDGSPKAQCCGKSYVVKGNRSGCKGYCIHNPDDGLSLPNWLLPFDAVSLVAY